jgi:hypothetical protein
MASGWFGEFLWSVKWFLISVLMVTLGVLLFLGLWAQGHAAHLRYGNRKIDRLDR